MKPNDRVNRIQEQQPTGATILEIHWNDALIEYDEGGQGWWPIAALESIKNARWADFATAVSASPEVNQFLATIFQAAPALYGTLTVGLGKAADGDSRVFLAAWSQAKVLGSVPVGLVASLRALATAHGLPVEFVEAL